MSTIKLKKGNDVWLIKETVHSRNIEDILNKPCDGFVLSYRDIEFDERELLWVENLNQLFYIYNFTEPKMYNGKMIYSYGFYTK